MIILKVFDSFDKLKVVIQHDHDFSISTISRPEFKLILDEDKGSVRYSVVKSINDCQKHRGMVYNIVFFDMHSDFDNNVIRLLISRTLHNV